MSTAPSAFTGSIPDFYERHLVPVIFTPYADDLVARVPAHDGVRVLEVACGTGVVTRRLLVALPGSAKIVATDLNPAMIEIAKQRVPDDPRLEWREADGTDLPFAEGEFDAVVCQFGVMFFPDKDAGMRSARRVLKPGGRFLFNVWDRFEANPFGKIAHETIGSFFDTDPPQFYFTPFGWNDPAVIEAAARAAGFRHVRVEPLALEVHGEGARSFATGLVRGNPVVASLREKGLDAERVEDAVAAKLTPVYGDTPLSGPSRALVVTAEA